LKAGEPVYAFKEATLADGLGVPKVGQQSFAVAQRCVDSVSLVSEKNIAIAMLRLIELEKTVQEGGGAAALSAILPDGPLFGAFSGKKVVVLLCGGNVDTSVLGRVIERGLAADGRLVRFSVKVSDRPGGIANLSAEIAHMGASIKDILHERAWLQTRIDQVIVKCVVETTDAQHTKNLYEHLVAKGYSVKGLVFDN
jgi:threonine dehydratase